MTIRKGFKLPKAVIGDFKKVIKRSEHPITRQVQVSDGFGTATDLVSVVRHRVDLPDGMYKIEGDTLVRDPEMPMNEFPEIPFEFECGIIVTPHNQPQGLVALTGEQIKVIVYWVDKIGLRSFCSVTKLSSSTVRAAIDGKKLSVNVRTRLNEIRYK